MTRVAVVTGGASGMGEATCHELGRRGHKVAVLDLDGQAAQRVCDELRAEGVTALAVAADVSDRSAVEEAFAKVRSELGPVHILVTSAGLVDFAPFIDITTEAWERLIAVNLTGTFHCCQVAVPDMVDAGWGRIVMISSSSAQRGSPNMAHYAASKGALLSLTKSLAREYGPVGITVNNIPPSGIETPMQHQWQAAGYLPSNEQMAASIPVGHLGHRRRHRRRGRVPVLGAGRLHHRPDPRRQRRVGDVTTSPLREGGSHGAAGRSRRRAAGRSTTRSSAPGRSSFDDSTSPEFYELEREAIFKRAWLNVGRVEELPEPGSYFTKEIDGRQDVDRSSCSGKDGEIRAFHNICRHRGNKLVWNDFPDEETKGTCRQFTCKYHGWRYDLDGALHVRAAGGRVLRPRQGRLRARARCTATSGTGFIFVNLDPNAAPESLREFLGPMITALDDYPFEQMTERYEFRRRQQQQLEDLRRRVPGVLPRARRCTRSRCRRRCAARTPASSARTSRLDGPHRLVSARPVPAAGRWRPSTCTRSNGRRAAAWSARGETPDIGDLPAGLNPGGIEPWGIRQLPDLPEPRDPDLPRVVPALPVLADLAQHPPVRGGRCTSTRARTRARAHRARGRRGGVQGVRAAGRRHARAAPRRRWSPGVVDEFPLSDQEILVRHFHKTVVDWVDEYQRAAHAGGGVTMTDARLPSAFAELEPFAATWCLATEAER